MKSNHCVLAIMGKSGCGKSSIIEKLCLEFPNDFYYVKSFTTRKKRKNDRKDKDTHFFVNTDFYKQMLNDKKIVALYDSPNGYHSFTTMDCFQERKINLYAIDPKAFLSLNKFFKEDNILGIYIDISEEERKNRYKKREKTLKGFSDESHLSKDILGKNCIVDVSNLTLDESVKKIKEVVLSWGN